MTKFLSFLGIVRKSGNLEVGYNKCEEAIKKNQISLLVVSLDASDNTLKKFKNYALKYNVRMIHDFKEDILGRSLGYDNIKVVGIKNRKMSRNLVSIYDSDVETEK